MASYSEDLDVVLVRENALQIEAGAFAERIAVRREDGLQVGIAPRDPCDEVGHRHRLAGLRMRHDSELRPQAVSPERSKISAAPWRRPRATSLSIMPGMNALPEQPEIIARVSPTFLVRGDR